ncbi:MAG: UTP--glucose-1-phosphate uridylyltransferase GalU [Candidatus Coatesbacteria bacterium]
MIQGSLRKVVIPAAGLGTRFLPATKAQPKEMLPIYDKPAIQYVVEEAVASGVEDVIVITGRNKQAIENHFDRSLELEAFLRQHGQKANLAEVRRISDLANLIYTRQKEPLGLGHAVLCARTLVGDEPFAVQLADDLIDAEVPAVRQLWDTAVRYGGSVIAVMEVPASQVSSYGIVAGDWVSNRVMRIREMVEKPSPSRAPSRLGIVGRYVLSPRVFSILERTRRGAKGEIQLTDALTRLAAEEPVFAYRFQGTRYDVGNKVGYVEACLAYGLKDREAGPKIRSLLRRMC